MINYDENGNLKDFEEDVCPYCGYVNGCGLH